MKVTNLQLVRILNILDETSRKRLPQRISYAITRNLMVVSREYKCYEKALQKIFDVYRGEFILNDNGEPKCNPFGIPLVKEEVSVAYFAEINDLLNIEIDIPLDQMPMDVFDYKDNDKYDALSALDIINLQSILCKDESKSETEGD